VSSPWTMPTPPHPYCVTFSCCMSQPTSLHTTACTVGICDGKVRLWNLKLPQMLPCPHLPSSGQGPSQAHRFPEHCHLAKLTCEKGGGLSHIDSLTDSRLAEPFARIEVVEGIYFLILHVLFIETRLLPGSYFCSFSGFLSTVTVRSQMLNVP
jgi:hypothetical protein